MNFIDTDLGGHLLCGLFPVTCEHDAAFHTDLLHAGDGLPGSLFDPVRDHDGTGEAAVHSHIDHSTAALASCVGNVLLFHEFLVSEKNSLSVHRYGYAVTGYLLRVRDTVHIDCLSISLPDGVCNRVVGIALAQSC